MFQAPVDCIHRVLVSRLVSEALEGEDVDNFCVQATLWDSKQHCRRVVMSESLQKVGELAKYVYTAGEERRLGVRNFMLVRLTHKDKTKEDRFEWPWIPAYEWA